MERKKILVTFKYNFAQLDFGSIYYQPPPPSKNTRKNSYLGCKTVARPSD